jgi:hypothetical protein
MQTILSNFLLIAGHVVLESGFLAVVALMFILGGRVKDSWRNLMAFWPILVPAVAVFLMYMMVHWEARFTTGAMLVAWGAAIVATNVSGEERQAKVFWLASLLLCALFVSRFSMVLFEDYREYGNSEQTVIVAERLRAMGIEPDTHIALIGDGDIASYWARLDRLKIIAEVPHDMKTGDSAAAFWGSSPQDETTVLNVLKSTGAKAVVADASPAVLPPGWLRLGSTGRAVYFFP